MTKSKSQFANLSEQDRSYIRELCSKHPYDHIVELLQKPRSEGGLDILTSRSALARFYASSHADTSVIVLAQNAAVANIQHEQISNAFLGAIRASVEARVYENLQSGKALADMEKEFRLLKTAESLYLADAQFRAKNPKAARAAYQQHVDHCAQMPDADFLPIDLVEGINAASLEISEPSQFEEDVASSRERQELEAQSRARLLASLGVRRAPPTVETAPESPKSPVIPHFPPNPTTGNQEPPSARHDLNPASARQPEALSNIQAKHSTPHSPPAPAPNPSHECHPEPAHRSEPLKFPESCIPDPGLPAKVNSSTPELSDNPAPAPAPRHPYTRATPKTGRNDPCPCGSGRKFKKCCSDQEHLRAA